MALGDGTPVSKDEHPAEPRATAVTLPQDLGWTPPQIREFSVHAVPWPFSCGAT